MKIAYVFPGQGAQAVGMGFDLYQGFASARAVFEQADKALGFSLSRLCFEGPDEELRQTINTQPAVVTMSFACLKAIQEISPRFPAPAFVAGHSLGEYTALAASGALDFENTIRLTKERGRLMHEAGQAKPGSMAAVMGLDETILSEICQQTGTGMANINCPGQIVISGTVDNINRALEQVKSKGGKAVLLQVSGAFHSPLMQPAADGLSKIVSSIPFKNPVVPIVANTSAQPLTTGEAIKAELLQQLCNSVQWQKSIEYMLGQGVTTFIEIGPGKVLTGLIKRINKSVKTLNIGDAETIKNLDNLLAELV